MAINPDDINTKRVGELPSAPINLSDKIPHEIGTELFQTNIQSLADFIKDYIGTVSSLAFNPTTVSDGGTLPVTETTEWILVGVGTFHNVGGAPDIVTTEELNALTSNGLFWKLAVEIPINVELAGIVQTIRSGFTQTTPSENTLYNALALKLNVSDLPNPDNKLDKVSAVTTNAQAYVKRADGNQTMFDIDEPSFESIYGSPAYGGSFDAYPFDRTVFSGLDGSISSSAAIKTYVENLLVGLFNDRGSYNPNTNANKYPTTGGSGTSGAIRKGDAWMISGLGSGVTAIIGTKTVNDGDVVRALINNPGNTDSNWAILEGNLGFVPENVSNKSSSFSVSSTTTYANTKALVDGLGTKQNALINPVTGTGANSQVSFWNGTNTQAGDSSLTWDNITKILNIGNALNFNGGANWNIIGTSSNITHTAGTGFTFNSASLNTPYRWVLGGIETFRIHSTSGNVTLQNGGVFTDAGFRFDNFGTSRFSSNINLNYTPPTSSSGFMLLSRNISTGDIEKVLSSYFLSGTSAANFLPVGTGTSTLGVSNILNDASSIKLRKGNIVLGDDTVSNNYFVSVETSMSNIANFQGSLQGVGAADISMQASGGGLLVGTAISTGERLQINGSLKTTSAKVTGLSGTGTRTVVADANGNLSATSTPPDSRPYKVYTALLTQSGTSAPVAAVLDNTLGGSVVWARSSTGVYNGTLTGAFTSGKTLMLSGIGGVTFLGCIRLSDNNIQLTTADTTGTFIDGRLNSASIEVRVYF